ncbi:MAG: sulfite exporter TauE/SafE family protein [Methyloligellaceae bacterium]
MELTFYTALMIGLLGSTHCLGMCGGIVGALNAGLPQSGRSQFSRIAHHFSYNAGRILSYVLAGALAGLAGSLLTESTLGTAAPAGRLIAGLLMVVLGLYLAGWWHAITAIEKAGLLVWRRIEPLGRRFLPAKTPLRAFGLGLVWGWLPCGLVYSALALSIVSASPHQGALIMLGFGLGTLPMLVAMGGVAEYAMKLVRKPVIRQLAGASVILFGIYTCVLAFSGHAHDHASAAHLTAGPNVSQPHTHAP